MVMVAYISVHHERVTLEQGYCGLLLNLIGENQTSLATISIYENDKHVLLLQVDLHRPKKSAAGGFFGTFVTVCNKVRRFVTNRAFLYLRTKKSPLARALSQKP